MSKRSYITNTYNRLKFVPVVFMGCFLIACGGGSGGSSDNNTNNSPQVVPTAGTMTTGGTSSLINNTDNNGSPGGSGGSNSIADSGGSSAATGSGGISCEGSRVWGPVAQDNGDQIYISEGFSAADDCTALWIYKPNVNNCSELFFLGDTQNAAVSNDGTLLFTEDGSPIFLPPANISLTDLFEAPDCPDEGSAGAAIADNNSGGSPDTPVAPASGAISCGGSRVWGPAIQPNGDEVYISEFSVPPGEVQSAENCTAVWVYRPNQNCSFLFSLTNVQSAVVSDSGTLLFTESGSPILLDPANVSLDELLSTPDCSSESTSGTSDGNNGGSSGINNDTPAGGSSTGLTPLSCNGNRVWGPFVDQIGFDAYMSEPNGRSEADWPQCGVLWYFDPARGCRITNIFANGVTLGVDSSGNGVIATQSGSQITVNTAGISFDDLANTPSCP